MRLPDNMGEIVIGVFIKQSEAAMEDREHAIADIGRAIRDFYLFGGAP